MTENRLLLPRQTLVTETKAFGTAPNKTAELIFIQTGWKNVSDTVKSSLGNDDNDGDDDDPRDWRGGEGERRAGNGIRKGKLKRTGEGARAGEQGEETYWYTAKQKALM